MKASDIRVFCNCSNEMGLQEFSDVEGKYWYCDECFTRIKITDNRLNTLED